MDRDFQFEKHTIRGLKKMQMFLTVTMGQYGETFKRGFDMKL